MVIDASTIRENFAIALLLGKAGVRMYKIPSDGRISPMRTPQESKTQRRARKKTEWIADNPNPYHEWPTTAADQKWLVEQAIGNEKFTWAKGKADRERHLSVEDLAVGLWAIKCTNKKGLNYGQLDYAFKTCLGKGCHRTKAAAVLAALVKLRLIEKIGNYSTGRRGNVYGTVRETPDLSVDWLPRKPDINVSQGKSAHEKSP